jgi:biotin carboxyl carrier protein
VAAGAELMLVESMKMEIPIAMPRAGRVVAVHVKPDDAISEGQLLVEIE